MLRRLAASFVRHGLRLPEYPISRTQELVQLRTLLRDSRINCVLDVGANRGQFARDLRDIGYDGHIVSFEPVRREFDVLLSEFSADPRWQGMPVALGDMTSTATMYVVPQLTVVSSLLVPLATRGVETCEVELRRLDEIFASLTAPMAEPRVLLKMDTQGYDLRVFEGAKGCLEKITALQSELSVVPLYDGMPHYTEALSVYEHHGFELVGLSLVCRSSTGALQELNCLMRRR